MKKNLTIATIGCASLLAVSALGNSIYELGTVVPSEPANSSDETTMVTDLIGSYNTGTPSSPFTITIGSHSLTATLAAGSSVPTAPLPAPGANNGQVVINNGPSSAYTVDLGTGGFNYLMIKWGRSSEFYYVGGLSGDVSFSNDINENGISHFDLWGGDSTVPDGGTTVLLLGAALSGLGLLRRKLS